MLHRSMIAAKKVYFCPTAMGQITTAESSAPLVTQPAPEGRWVSELHNSRGAASCSGLCRSVLECVVCRPVLAVEEKERRPSQPEMGHWALIAPAKAASTLRKVSRAIRLSLVACACDVRGRN